MRRSLLALALLLALPASAHAADPTVINFDGLANEESVREQYAGQGVRFGQPADFGLGTPTTRTCPGPPRGRTGGIAGTSITLDCVTGLGETDRDRQFSAAIEFATERRHVRFDMQERVGGNAAVNATIRVHSVTGQLLTELQRTVTAATTEIVVTRAQSEIGYIVISGNLDDVSDANAGDILLDNLVAQLDDQPPPAKFRPILTTPTIGVFEGGTGVATVSIRRFNGSSGPVTLSVGGLPNGIRSTEFVPNPSSGTNPVQFRILAASPASGQRQITVNASGGNGAGTNVGGPLVQSVNLLPAIVQLGGGSPIPLAAGCGPQRVPVAIEVRGEYAGIVDLAPTAGGGLGVSADPNVLNVEGAGSYPYDVVVDPGTAAGAQEVTLNARPRDATAASATMTVVTTPVELIATPTETIARPRLGRKGQITVRGRFGGCPLRFRDSLGQDWPVLDKARNDQGEDVWTLEVRRNAVPGPLRLLGPSGTTVATTPPLDVVDYRNTHAPSQANSGPGARTPDLTWEDFALTFGPDDTYACPLPRGFLEAAPAFIGNAVCVRDPIAWGHFLVYQGRVESDPGRGLCSGWSTMARRAKRRIFAGSPPRAFNEPWGDGTSNKTLVVRAHLAQHDEGFQDALDNAYDRSPAEERAFIRDAIEQEGDAYVAFQQGDRGHAVVAYDYQEFLAPGGTAIRLAIYDPNDPFDGGEQSSLDTRNDTLDNRSVITIQPDGRWQGSTLGWSGPNDKLAVTRAVPPLDSKLPLALDIATFFDAAEGPDPAKVTGIEAGGEDVLGEGGEPRAGSGVKLRPDLTGGGPAPEWHLERGREYAFKITGTGAGSYGHGLLGHGVLAQVEGARTAPGQVDEVTMRPGQAQVGFASAGGGNVELNLADRVGGTTRTAKVALGAAKGGSDEAELSGGALRVRHSGRATQATITLGNVGGKGLPGSATTAVRLGPGQSAELRPRSWRSLGGRVTLTVRDKRGRVVRRGRARLRASRLVSLSRVGAKRSGRRVRVTGSVGRRGSAPLLLAVVEQLRGGRVVARKSAGLRGAQVKAGRFSLPVNVGRVRAGTKLRATVTLVDEAEQAAVVKRVRVR